MNYFTKEWYELCQKTSFYLSLRSDKKAEYFSDEYFQRLYNRKLKEWLKLQKEVASVTFEEVLKKYTLKDLIENMSEDEIKKLMAEYRLSCEKAKEHFFTKTPFNRNEEIQKFNDSFLNNQLHLKKTLPEEILEQIADIRVFALDRASHKVKSDVIQFCRGNEKSVKKTIKEYEKYFKKALNSFDINMVENINFHDCNIIDIKQTEHTLSILFDNSGGFTDLDEMQFENYKIIKQEALLQNLWWIYDEIYKTNGKYELHVLLGNDMDLVEFIVSAEHISFKHSQEK